MISTTSITGNNIYKNEKNKNENRRANESDIKNKKN